MESGNHVKGIDVRQEIVNYCAGKRFIVCELSVLELVVCSLLWSAPLERAHGSSVKGIM